MINFLQNFILLAQISIPEDDIVLPKGEVGPSSVTTILELAFAALGSIAFIVMVVAGLKFVLSRGNPDAIAKARNTIIYAAIGLLVSILSFAIVRFVLRSVM